MAKVYSWDLGNNLYAYIVDPQNLNEGYVGERLNNEDLNIVKDWASTCTEEDYEEHFNSIIQQCAGMDVKFESYTSYLNIPTSCDNLRGRGILRIEATDIPGPGTNERMYRVIYTDDPDGNGDLIPIQQGINGINGRDGKDGAPGDIGYYSKFIMIYTSGKDENGNILDEVETPTGGSYDFTKNETTYPNKWGANNSDFMPPIWMSTRTFVSNDKLSDKEWSKPVRITGENGAPGEDGTSIEFIYYISNIEPSTENLPSENINGYVPTEAGWTASPHGVSEDETTEWCSQRRKIKDGENEHWGPWSKATIWSKYGVNGQDGDGVQYIYIKNKGELPKNPTPLDWKTNEEYQNKNSEWIPSTNDYTNIKGETVSTKPLENVDSDKVPAGVWSDNPVDVDMTFQYQWVSTRKYKKDVDGKMYWFEYSDPSLWGKYGENGKSGQSLRKLYALSDSTSNPPELPGSSTETGDWGTGFPKDYRQGENVVWGTEAIIWADNNEFVNEGWCEPYLVTGLKGDKGDPIDYTMYAFGYGLKDFTPNRPNGTSIDNLGVSLDEKGNTIIWEDYPDTSNNRIDGAKDENGYEKRWYQCIAYVDGLNGKIKEWGAVSPCSGRDGLAGNYTEMRFAVTENTNKPDLIYLDEGKVIREPEYLNSKGDKWGWFDTDEQIPPLPKGGAMWQIWATIDGTTNEVIGKWNGPVRISGEKGDQGEQGPAGLRGVTGIPGATSNQMYCLGTYGKNETSESYWESGDGYFGGQEWKNDVLPSGLTGWYTGKNMPYSDFIDVTTLNEVETKSKDINNQGRVIRLIEAKEEIKDGSKFVSVNYTYYLAQEYNNSTYRLIKGPIPSDEEFDIYIWCIQGNEKWEKGTVDNNTDGDKVEHKLVGIDWSNPFKLQGTNGLRGLAGNRGQVVYPMGVYNQEEVYITTDTKAPYVYDPNDGLFYVYNIVNQPWVGKLPLDYKNIKKDDGTYKYSIDGTGNDNTWLTDQQGDTPANNYANATNDNRQPAWVRFESFQALYTSIGIIANGMIGSAVYNNEFMFSQQGIDKDGNKSNYAQVSGEHTDYGFLSGYEYDEQGNQLGYHWKYRGTNDYIKDTDVNPYEKNGDNKYIHTFMPNVCINFATGQMWLQCGHLTFGQLNSNVYTKNEIKSIEEQIQKSIEDYNTSLNKDISDLSKIVNDNKTEILSQVDKKAEMHYRPDDPSLGWQIKNSATTSTYAEERIGDMWYDTDDQKSYIFAKGNIGDKLGKKSENVNLINLYYWAESNVPQSVYDKIDGKSNIFVEEPQIPYNVGDLWFVHNDSYKNMSFYDGKTGITSGTCLVCLVQNIDGEFNTEHWGKLDNYADEVAVNNALTELFEIQGILDKMDDDGYLDEKEIRVLNDELKTIKAEYSGITEQATALLLNNEENYNNYITAYNNVCETIEYYSGKIKEDTSPSHKRVQIINDKSKPYYYGNISEYYEKRQLLLTAISLRLNENTNEVDKKINEEISRIESAITESNTELKNYVDTQISVQTDNVISTHYGKEDPSEKWQKSNSAETSTYAENKLGDLWFNTEKNASYTFTNQNQGNVIPSKISGYYWVTPDVEIPDDIYDKIDGKANIFVEKPTAPYYIGDMWIVENDSYKETEFAGKTSGITEGTVLICVSGSTGDTISYSDWGDRIKYTDDAVANQAKEDIKNVKNDLKNWANDGILNSTELKNLKNELNTIQGEYGIITAQTETLGLTANSAYTNYTSAYDTTVNTINYYLTGAEKDEYGSVNVIKDSENKYYYGNIVNYYINKEKLLRLISDTLNSNINKVSEDLVMEIAKRETEIKNSNDKLEDYIEEIQIQINDIQKQVDGSISTYYGAEDPSSGWTIDNAADKLGDLWFNTTSNKSYTFTNNKENQEYINSEIDGYYWVRTDVVSQDIFDILDGKSNIFVKEPKPPYNSGDLWIVGDNSYTGKTFYGGETGITEGTILVCVEENTGDTISYSDWGDRVKYADEASVENALNTAQSAINRLNAWDEDGYLSPSELKELKHEKERINSEYYVITADCNTYKLDISGYQSAYDSAMTVIDYYLNKNNWDDNGCIKIETTGNYNYKVLEMYYSVRQNTLNTLSVKVSTAISDSATTILRTEIETNKKDILTQVDKKADMYYRPDDPSLGWQRNNSAETSTYADNKIGDIWYDTDDQKSYMFASGSTGTKLGKNSENSNLKDYYYWAESNVPQDVYDKIDGKNSVFITEPSIPYYKGDIWFVHDDIYKNKSFAGGVTGITPGTCVVCVEDNISDTFNTSHWGKRDSYVDIDKVNEKISEKDWLYDSFSSGSTEISGGLVLSQFLAVKDNYGNVAGYLNGTTNNSQLQTSYGDIMLGIGVESTTAATLDTHQWINRDDGTSYIYTIKDKQQISIGTSEIILKRNDDESFESINGEVISSGDTKVIKYNNKIYSYRTISNFDISKYAAIPTKIYKNGHIEARSLNIIGGQYEGNINAGGVFYGNLDVESGNLYGVNIDKSKISDSEIVLSKDKDLRVINENNETTIRIHGGIVEDNNNTETRYSTQTFDTGTIYNHDISSPKIYSFTKNLLTFAKKYNADDNFTIDVGSILISSSIRFMRYYDGGRERATIIPALDTTGSTNVNIYINVFGDNKTTPLTSITIFNGKLDGTTISDLQTGFTYTSSYFDKFINANTFNKSSYSGITGDFDTLRFELMCEGSMTIPPRLGQNYKDSLAYFRINGIDVKFTNNYIVDIFEIGANGIKYRTQSEGTYLYMDQYKLKFERDNYKICIKDNSTRDNKDYPGISIISYDSNQNKACVFRIYEPTLGKPMIEMKVNGKGFEIDEAGFRQVK